MSRYAVTTQRQTQNKRLFTNGNGSSSNGGPSTLTINNIGNGYEFPLVEDRVEESIEIWARELRALFEHAKERYGDVSWESEESTGQEERIWGHKAVIYARAPKAFKERYFISRPFSRSPTSFRSPSPSIHHTYPTRSASPHASGPGSNGPSSFRGLSPLPQANGRGSTLSVNTIKSEGTIRGNGDGILRLTHGDTPELFRAQLEWLYTGEGFGDVVEWISAEDDSGLGGSIRDSLGRRGNIAERRDKLGQDLTYMWRSKLYADARIHLTTQPTSSSDDSASEDSDDSSDSLSSTAIFTSHRFILASRSPYFASVLLNPSSFKPHTTDIHLPTPPFTPAALHFCLGYIYAGHLDFSNRSFDLLTAFQIHRAAAYLQLESLIAEIESRLVYDFCHGLDPRKVHCARCPSRAARVWRFATCSDVGAVRLAAKARHYIVTRWGESWGRDVATADERERKSLMDSVIQSINSGNTIATFQSIQQIKARIEAGIRSRGQAATVWVDPLEEMLGIVQAHAGKILVNNFASIADGVELWDLVSGKGFNSDLLGTVSNILVDSVGSPHGCIEGPRIYQAMVSSILLRVEADSLETALPARSQGRQQIELAKEGILGQIRRRWMLIRDGGGFNDLENWSLKEISDEIEVPVDDLLSGLPYTPPPILKTAPNTGGRPLQPRSHLPRLPAHLASESDSRSVRSSTSPRISSASRPSVHGRTAEQSPDKSGLRRLRLSSSASASSMNSPRSSLASRQAPPSQSMTGPTARSPTAALQGPRVSVGGGSRRVPGRPVSPSPSSRTTPRSISGPPRPLMTRATPRQGVSAQASPGRAPSIASVRSARTTTTTKSAATLGRTPNSSPQKRQVAVPTPIQKASTPKAGVGVDGGSQAGPSRPRSVSGASTASSRSRNVNGSRSTSTKAAGDTAIPPVPSLLGKGKTPPVAPSIRSQVSLAPSVRSQATVGNRSVAPSMTSIRTLTKPPGTPRSTARTIGTSTTSSPSRRPAKRGEDPTQASPTKAKSLHPPSHISVSKSSSATSQSTGRSSLAPNLPSNLGSVPANRSASSSTDGTEARTPKLMRTVLPSSEPRIHRDGSDPSDLSSPRTPDSELPPPSMSIPTFITTTSSPSKPLPKFASSQIPTSPTKPNHATANLPPPVSMPRNTRKLSTASTKSTASSRLHPASAFDPPRRSISVPVVEPKSQEIPDGCTPFTGKGVALTEGIPCIISLKSKRARFKALVKYIGYMKGSRGPWLGIEAEDLNRFNVKYLDTGSKDGIHYFHVSTPSSTEDPTYDIDERLSQQRRIEIIRESLGKTSLTGLGFAPSRIGGLPGPKQLGYGLGIDAAMRGGGVKRSTSPNPFAEWGNGNGHGMERPQVLFVRPSEVVYVLGAE